MAPPRSAFSLLILLCHHHLGLDPLSLSLSQQLRPAILLLTLLDELLCVHHMNFRGLVQGLPVSSQDGIYRSRWVLLCLL